MGVPPRARGTMLITITCQLSGWKHSSRVRDFTFTGGESICRVSGVRANEERERLARSWVACACFVIKGVIFRLCRRRRVAQKWAVAGVSAIFRLGSLVA
eukprot:2185177-Prymnesium_polylepis.1